VKQVLQQGQADGLCGLYSVLNFLERTEWKDWVDHNLQSLLYAAQHFGWFTPHHLTAGFEDHQLKAILDLQFSNYRMSYQTAFLSDVLASCDDDRFHELLERIVAKGGSAIIHKDIKDGGHWLLVTRDDGDTVVLDSDDQKRPRSLLAERRLKRSEWGVVILPCKRPKLHLDL